MKRCLTQAFAVLLLSVSGAHAADDPPAAEEILRLARGASTQSQAAVRAELENEDGDSVPLTIRANNGVVRYEFTDPPQAIELVFGEASSELREQRGGRTAPVRPARFDEPVRGTNVTYEDLSLRLLYWPGPKVVGEETIRTRRTWKVELQAPAGQSQYGAALVWIDQKTGAVMQIEAYDARGKLAKSFEVISAQQLGGRWMLRTMRVESMDPATGRPTARTYLRIRGEVGSAG